MTGTSFSLPDLGEGLHEAEIVAWHVAVGDHVVADQPLVTVETDKALVEVPSPRSGHIESLHGKPGDIVAVGDTLVVFAAGPAEDAGAIVGKVAKAEAGAVTKADRGEATKSGSGERAKADIGNVAGAGPIAQASKPAGPSAGASAAAPAVRRLASTLGVDLSRIAGSGVDGSITRADVEAAAGARATGGATGPTADAAAIGEPLRGVRRAMFLNMTRAGREVVPATVNDEADIEQWPDGEDVTVRLIRALVAGCRESPALNAWFDTEAQVRTLHRRIDLGLAVETDEGLFAPVIADVGALDTEALRREIETIKQSLAARSVPRERLVGQTITLSNFGMFGGRFAGLVVVPPQVAILGAGRVDRRPVASAGAVAVHRVLPLSLSFDHRVVTGVEATRFLGAAVADLEASG